MCTHFAQQRYCEWGGGGGLVGWCVSLLYRKSLWLRAFWVKALDEECWQFRCISYFPFRSSPHSTLVGYMHASQCPIWINAHANGNTINRKRHSEFVCMETAGLGWVKDIVKCYPRGLDLEFRANHFWNPFRRNNVDKLCVWDGPADRV